MKKPIRIFLAVLAFLVLPTIGILYYLRDQSLERLRSTREIRIGYAVEPPHAFVDPQKQVVGHSPELARKIVARLGVEKIDWRQAEFNKLLDELRNGRIDVIAAGMFITKERGAIANFSEPVFHVREGLLVAFGNPREILSYDSVTNSQTIRVAVVAGSYEYDYFKRKGVGDSRIVVVPDAITGRVAVENGNADCLALSSPAVHWMSINEGFGATQEIAIDPIIESAERNYGYGGFAFRKEDVALLDAWNKAQREFMATEEFSETSRRFGFTDAELPGTVTTAELLAK